MVPAIRPTKQLSITRAFLLCWLTIRHQRAPRIYLCLDSWRFWAGYRIMLPLSMLVVHSERVAISSSASYQLLADLGLCLVQDAYGICVPVKVAGDHNMRSGLASSLCCGCCGVIAMPLLLSLALWWWGWHCCCCRCCGPSLALLLMARAVLVDFCCTGCCCHGDCMLVNKGGPFVVFAMTDLPIFSGPRGGPVGKCLRKVFIKK